MNDFDYGHLTYLILLGIVVVGWFIAQNRNSLGKVAQQAMIWVFLFIGVIAVVGLWEDVRQTAVPRQAVTAEAGRIELPRAPDGHYYLQAEINGTPIEFVVDTGATDIVLSQADAEKAGLDPDNLDYIGRAYTANGEVRTAPVRLGEVAVGEIIDHSVSAVVNQGDLDGSLLGMSYLQRYDSIEIRNGTLVLTR